MVPMKANTKNTYEKGLTIMWNIEKTKERSGNDWWKIKNMGGRDYVRRRNQGNIHNTMMGGGNDCKINARNMMFCTQTDKE